MIITPGYLFKPVFVVYFNQLLGVAHSAHSQKLVKICFLKFFYMFQQDSNVKMMENQHIFALFPSTFLILKVITDKLQEEDDFMYLKTHFHKFHDQHFCVNQCYGKRKKYAHLYLIFCDFVSFRKCAKNRFQPAFGVRNTQTLVKIYNKSILRSRGG